MSESSTSPSLLIKIKSQDSDGWHRFVDLYGPLIFSWAKRYGFASEDASDIVQEVLALVARSIDQYQAKADSTFRAWLWTVTRNKLHDTFRRQQSKQAAVGGTHMWKQLEQIPELWSDDSCDSSMTETQDLMRRCMNLIRNDFEEKTWKAFWRSVVLGQDTQTIADELNLPANSVRKYKSRVLMRLRQELGDQQ